MTHEQSQPIDAAELRRLATEVIAAEPFPYLASIDGDQPRLRPVSPVRTDGFTVYIANLRAYHKTVEIAVLAVMLAVLTVVFFFQDLVTRSARASARKRALKATLAAYCLGSCSLGLSGD